MGIFVDGKAVGSVIGTKILCGDWDGAPDVGDSIEIGADEDELDGSLV